MMRKEFLVSLPPNGCLIVHDGVGCTAQVRYGEVWITTQGLSADTIAGAGKCVRLDRRGATVISAFGYTSIAIVPPRDAYELAFELRRTGSTRVLKVKRQSDRTLNPLEGWLRPAG